MNRNQAQRRNTRLGMTDSVLKLLIRSPGQDLLLAGEQDRVSHVNLPITAAPEKMAGLIESGYELASIGIRGADLVRFEGIHDPVPAGQYEAASQGV